MSSSDWPQEKFSAPFEISRYDEFGENRISIVFRLKNGQPVRLGDGTYGTVYLGRSLAFPYDIAIKLLYDNKSIRPRPLRELSREEKESIVDSLMREPRFQFGDREQARLKELVVDHKDSDLALLRKLKSEIIIDDNVAPKGDHPGPKLTLDNLLLFLEAVVEVASSSAVFRFRSERDVSRHLMDSNELKGLGRETTGLVNVWGGAEDFAATLSKPEFHPLKKYFEDTQLIKFSNYVLVMDRYQYSLKDLLEGAIKQDDPRTGYEVLRDLPHDRRVREALLILKDVAFGLYQLHNVKKLNGIMHYFHLDIKPGNILIKEKSNGYFDVALADLGNLPLLPENMPQDWLPEGSLAKPVDGDFDVTLADLGNLPHRLPGGSLAMPVDYDYAPGTHHYRSPEQKYYLDVANVRVMHLEEDGLDASISAILENEANTHSLDVEVDQSDTVLDEAEEMDRDDAADNPPMPGSADHTAQGENITKKQKRVVLIVQDPKFKNTLIEEEDFAIFSKDTGRKRRYIAECFPSKDQSGHFAFVLTGEAEDTGPLSEDDKTQVEFYKIQGFRTDLFGIGAVAFDMITAGWSPEKFYESIRKFETLSIEVIKRRYDTLRRGEIEGENADLSQIFLPFRNDIDASKRYPDTDIIEFILKCMLYQSSGTFYQQYKNQPQEAIRALREELEKLRHEYNVDSNLPAERSILIHRPALPSESLGRSIQFDQEIAKLQGLVTWPEVDEIEDASLLAVNRLLYGAYYFSQIVDTVRQKNLPRNSPPYLLQILPTYITLEGKQNKADLNFDSALKWTDRKQFLKELRDNNLEQLIRSATNPFVPNWVAGLRRDIQLFVQQVHNGEMSIQCKYRFRDASLFDSKVTPGDWIVCQGQLWKVVEPINNNTLTIELETIEVEPINESKVEWPVNGEVRGTYFTAFDPFKYYLDMLGMYLQQLIFAYSPITTTTRKRLNIPEVLHTLEVHPPITLTARDLDSANKLKDIFVDYVYLLLRLTLHESEDSYFHRAKSKSETDALEEAFKFAIGIYERILKLLDGQAGGITSDLPEKFFDSFETISELQGMVEELTGDPFDIEMTIKQSGIIGWGTR